MAKVFKGQGNIFVDQGVSGVDVSGSIMDGFLAGLKNHGPKSRSPAPTSGITRPFLSNGNHEPVRLAPGCERHHDRGLLHPRGQRAEAAGESAVPAVCYGSTARCRLRHRWPRVRGPDQHPSSGAAGHEDGTEHATWRQAARARKTLIPVRCICTSRDAQGDPQCEGVRDNVGSDSEDGVNYFPKLAAALRCRTRFLLPPRTSATAGGRVVSRRLRRR